MDELRQVPLRVDEKAPIFCLELNSLKADLRGGLDQIDGAMSKSDVETNVLLTKLDYLTSNVSVLLGGPWRISC